MSLRKHIFVFFFFTILLFGSIIRLGALETYPLGFHQDEVANAYVGRFILDNGVDPYGNPWPLLFFDKHGDFPPVIPMYLSGLGTYFFGFSMTGARIVGALFGVMALPLMYAFTRLVYKNNFTALVAMGALTISPWHISFSRMSTEGTIALTTFLAGLTLLLHSLRAKRFALILNIGAGALLALTYLLYPSYRLSVPIVALGLWVVKRRKARANWLLVLSVSLIMLTGAIALTPWGSGRLEQTSIMHNLQQSTIPTLAASDPNPITARLFNNKYLLSARVLAAQTLTYLNPTYLFVQSSSPPWFSTPQTGLLYMSFGVLGAIGIVQSVKKRKNRAGQFAPKLLLLLALAALIPGVLTTDHTPHAHRVLLLIAPLTLLAALGATWLTQHKRIAVALMFAFIAEASLFGYNYLVQMNPATTISRSQANLPLAQYLAQNQSASSPMLVMTTGWMPVYYLYATGNTNPGLVGQIPRNFRAKSVDFVRFADADCPTPDTQAVLLEAMQMKGAKVVMSSSCENVPDELQQVREITAADTSTVYRIYGVAHQ